MAMQRTTVGLVIGALIVVGCAASAPPATPRPLDFTGTLTNAVTALEADGFSCLVNDPTTASLPPGYASPLYASFSGECRRDAAPDQAIQGTFVELYGLRSDDSLVGVDIRSDRLGPDPASSSTVPAILAHAFAPADAATVVAAIRALGTGGPTWTIVSSRVQVHSETSPLLFSIEIWGTAVTAFHDALVAGPSTSP